jgi:hypothetical protein
VEQDEDDAFIVVESQVPVVTQDQVWRSHKCLLSRRIRYEGVTSACCHAGSGMFSFLILILATCLALIVVQRSQWLNVSWFLWAPPRNVLGYAIKQAAAASCNFILQISTWREDYEELSVCENSLLRGIYLGLEGWGGNNRRMEKIA